TSSSDLQRMLAKVGGVVPTKSTMPILENLLFDLLNDTLTITATDLEVSLTVSLQVRGIEDGRIAVPAKRLTDTIRNLPNIITTFSIDTATNRIKVTTANGEYNLTGEDAKEFPAVPPFKGTEEVTMENDLIRKLIYRTSFAVSADELRPAMMGVLLQPKGIELRAVATDGHRLVKCSHKFENTVGLKRDIIVPAKALNILSKSAESGSNTISISDTHIKFNFDSTELISRLIEETYPNYESVIPQENNKTLTVNREQLLSSIRRVGLYASATTHQIRFQMGKQALNISAQDIDFGGEAKETLECEYSGDEMEIGFNSQYVMEILAHLDSEQISFNFSSPTRAGIVSPVGSKESEDVMMLVMPVRLNA
ncbi:MAG: DNA polymerase III subunit beta, partial [Ignavibacteriae bacterium]|nr:DNA polymerase III subunit beta [Ignavibacteriota bacterium]